MTAASLRAQERALLTTQKTPFQWLLYLCFAILPFVVGFYSLIRISGMEEKPSLPSPNPDITTPCIPFFFLFMAIEFLIYLGKKGAYRLNDTVSSLSQGTLQQLFGIVLKSFVVFPYAFLRQRFAVITWEDEDRFDWTYPQWWLMMLAVEWGYYWMHRMAHEWNALWAAHIVHHSSNNYNLSTALRQGALQPSYSWVFYLFAAPFFPHRLFLIHSQLNALYQFWIHTQVFDKLPAPLEYVLNTPSHHRVHHGKNPQYIDKNYGGTLIIFDRMFGTFEPEVEEPIFGITHSLETWNPFYAQTHHWAEMWEAAKKSVGWSDKIRVFLDYGPAYNYFLLHLETSSEPHSTPSESNGTVEEDIRYKYDSSPANPVMTWYAFLHWALLMFFTNEFLSRLSLLDVQMKILGVSFICFGLYSLSALFDQKRWVWLLEIFRVCLSFSFVVWLLLPEYSMPFFFAEPRLIALGGVTVLSILLLSVVPSSSPLKAKTA